MRRSDRQTGETEAWSILERGEYGVLSTASTDAAPYGVPLSYCVVNGNIYLHCAVEGRKLDIIRGNPKVSFCVVGKTEVLPDKLSTRYESCIVEGTASEVSGDEKRSALQGLVTRYSKGFEAEGLQHIEKLWEETIVVRITVDSLSGKARR